jgi:hypothetical protein
MILKSFRKKPIINLYLILFISFFYLIQGGVGVGYAEGTSLNFGNLINLLPVELPPNVKIPDITPNSPGNTPSSTLPDTSQYHNQYTPTQDLTNINTTYKSTDELLRPVLFSPLTEDEPLLPMAEHYVCKMCIKYNGITAVGCADNATPEQASEKLAAIILNKSLKGEKTRPFKIVMPSSMPSDQQIQLLCKIETGAIGLIEAKLLKEGRKEKPFITEEAEKARKDAESGIHWSHNWQDDKASHQFHAGKAFGQLNNTAISER